MSNFDDENEKLVVDDLVDYAVRALSNSIPLLARKLLTSRWTGVVPQSLDSPNDPLADVLLGDGFNLSYGRWLDPDAISCHCA